MFSSTLRVWPRQATSTVADITSPSSQMRANTSSQICIPSMRSSYPSSTYRHLNISPRPWPSQTPRYWFTTSPTRRRSLTSSHLRITSTARSTQAGPQAPRPRRKAGFISPARPPDETHATRPTTQSHTTSCSSAQSGTYPTRFARYPGWKAN